MRGESIEQDRINQNQRSQNCSKGIAKSPLVAWIWQSRPSESNSSQNLRVIAITSFLTGLFSTMTRAVWQPFVLSL